MAIKRYAQAIQRLLGEIPEPYRPVIGEWEKDARAMGTKDASRLRNLYPLKDFALFLQERGRPLEALTWEDVRDYLNRQETPQKREKGKAVLRGFLRWLATDGRGGRFEELAQRIVFKVANAADLPVEALLAPEDVRALMEAADHPRDRGLVIALYESAFTNNEFLSLNVGSVETHDPRTFWLVLPRGVREHGGRRVPMPKATPALQVWLDHHPQRGDAKAPLWVSFDHALKRGAPRPRLSESALNYVLKSLAKRAGVQKPVHPHAFRHARLTILGSLMREMELRQFAGWSKTSRMPARYLHLSGGEAAERILQAEGLLGEETQQAKEKALEPRECPRCRQRNLPVARFCIRCGLALTDEAVRAAEDAKESVVERLERLERLLLERFEELGVGEQAHL